MLCCLQTPWSNPQNEYNRQTSDGLSSYPGNRRYTKTGGNALAAAPPSHPSYQQQLQSSSVNGGDLVSVTVPPGVSGGQTIHVSAPDRSGRTVMATVPQGMSPGSSFMVQFPSNGMSSSSPVSASVVSSSVPPTAPPQHDPVDYSTVPLMRPPPYDEAEPFVPAVPLGAAPGSTTIAPTAGHYNAAPPAPWPSPMPAPFGETTLRVQVPPDTQPGTTIQVQVPGENRTISAQVPPGNVSSFHVPYEAQPQQAAPIIQTAIPEPQDKLLLVRVPPGTAPGTLLHVTIPDEPGRVIAATVPPGNVSEFHVSYKPSTNNAARSTHPPVRYSDNNGYQSRPPNNGYSNNRPNRNSGGMGSMLLPALGGMALGAAGMSMFDHLHHRNDNDYGGGYADAGGGADNWGADDYGGDDFGGDMDFGGDFGDF